MDLEEKIIKIITLHPRRANWVTDCTAKILDLVQQEFDERIGWYPQEIAYWKQQYEDLSLELELEQNTILKFPTPNKVKCHRWRNLK